MSPVNHPRNLPPADGWSGWLGGVVMLFFANTETARLT